jgi:hypothetical protein
MARGPAGREDTHDNGARPEGPGESAPAGPYDDEDTAIAQETAGWPEPWTILPRPEADPVWPATPPLAHGLALARALRPLRLRRPSPGAWELDEEATAERAAAEDLWLPVCRPADERRLDLTVLVDAGPSMALWQDTVRQIRALMEQTAAFRAISTSRLDITAAGSVLRANGTAFGSGGSAPDSLVLVITDGVAEAWRNGDAAAYLYSSAQTSPTAVLSLLPQEMWEITLPTAVRAQLAVHDAAVPNRLFRLGRTSTPTSVLGDPLPTRSGASAPVPVPLLELTPGSLARWARLVASPGGRHDLAVLLTSRHGDPEARSHHSATLPRPLPGRAREGVPHSLRPGPAAGRRPAQPARHAPDPAHAARRGGLEPRRDHAVRPVTADGPGQ